MFRSFKLLVEFLEGTGIREAYVRYQRILCYGEIMSFSKDNKPQILFLEDL